MYHINLIMTYDFSLYMIWTNDEFYTNLNYDFWKCTNSFIETLYSIIIHWAFAHSLYYVCRWAGTWPGPELTAFCFVFVSQLLCFPRRFRTKPKAMAVFVFMLVSVTVCTVRSWDVHFVNIVYLDWHVYVYINKFWNILSHVRYHSSLVLVYFVLLLLQPLIIC